MWWEHLVSFYRSITLYNLEPVLLLFSVSQGLSLVITKDLYIEKTCMVNFNNSIEICSNLYLHKDIQKEVQGHVSVLKSINGPLQALTFLKLNELNLFFTYYRITFHSIITSKDNLFVTTSIMINLLWSNASFHQL